MKRLALIAAIIDAVILVIVVATAPSRGPQAYTVRAIFDNAAFAVSGEQVRIAGAPVGTISAVGLTRQDLAAVTLSITNTAFRPFHANATCRIRPQSLIAERYVDCLPGTASAPPLERLTTGPGAGDYLLPVTQTSTSIDPDIVQNISQESLRQRLSIILDELGTGLAARGADLNAVIRRANPSLAYTDQVFQILARQRRVLAQLASDSQAVLGPLARARSRIAEFIVQANTTAQASAARARDISRGIALLPSFLRQLRPLMVDLGNLAAQGTPLMSSLGQSAAAIDRQFANLIPFAQAARPALIALGNSAQRSQPALVGSQPLAERLNQLGTSAVPSAILLDRLTHSLDVSGAIEQLMAVLFYGTGASNGFDSIGHYVRAEPLVGGCTAYAKKPVPDCSANFGRATTAGVASVSTSLVAPTGATGAIATSAVRTTAARTPPAAQLSGLLRYLVGGGS